MIPGSLLEVMVAASQVLVDLPTLKADLGIADSSQDARLTRIIAATGAMICAYVERPLIEQSYRETWRLPVGGIDWQWQASVPVDKVVALPLSRSPLISIAAVVETGITLDSSLYSFIDGRGLVRLDAAGAESGWARGTIVVTYDAGYDPPVGGDADSAFPPDLYEAALLAARASFYAKDRDPGTVLRSEEVPDVYRADYDVQAGLNGAGASAGSYGLPGPVIVVLDSYRLQRSFY